MKVHQTLAAGMCLLAGTAKAASAYNCSIPTVQSLINSVADNTTTAVVAIAQRIDSNTTLKAFEKLVSASSLRSNLTDVCAIRVNVTTTAGSNYAFGAFLPDVWYQRIM